MRPVKLDCRFQVPSGPLYVPVLMQDLKVRKYEQAVLGPLLRLAGQSAIKRSACRNKKENNNSELFIYLLYCNYILSVKRCVASFSEAAVREAGGTAAEPGHGSEEAGKGREEVQIPRTTRKTFARLTLCGFPERRPLVRTYPGSDWNFPSLFFRVCRRERLVYVGISVENIIPNPVSTVRHVLIKILWLE